MCKPDWYASHYSATANIVICLMLLRNELLYVWVGNVLNVSFEPVFGFLDGLVV